MSESTSHLERTSTIKRNDILCKAEVTEKTCLSPTVIGVELFVSDDKFSFRPGQWIDTYIPNISTVGGFSITSSQEYFISARKIGLAIKYSDHPPAHWFHNKCEVGDEIEIRSGGDFFPREEDKKTSLLLFAGGVGINPILSILSSVTKNSSHVTLFYSAKSSEELIFKKEIDRLCQKNDNFKRYYFITKEKLCEAEKSICNRRMNKNDIRKAIELLRSFNSQPKAFICGPTSMIDDVESCLKSENFTQNQICYEKWW